jgi:hypothetical protein
MIYFLPERIYNYILENKVSDVLDKLNALSDKYNSFTTFEEYIKYSSLFIENEDNKKVYSDIKSSIEEALKNKPILLQEFEIISKDFIGEEYIHNTKALDDENYLAILIAFIDFNDSNKKDVYFSYMKTFIKYFESHESKNYSKFIYYNYIAYKILIDSTSKDFITSSMSEEDITSKCMNTIKKYYNKTLEYSSDKDNINSQFCDWVCFYIHNINQLLEDNRIKIDLQDLYNKLDNFLYSEIGDYQYKKYNYGYLRFCDTMLMYLLFSISNTNRAERITTCKELLNKIIDLFNDGLTNMPTLLRGLSYYDRSKVIKYAVLLRKYATIAINNEKILNGKIINTSPEDLKFALSTDISTTKMDNYTFNRINNIEAIQKNDEEAELVSNFIKLLGMTNVRTN